MKTLAALMLTVSLTAQADVLYIGDSHTVGTFGQELTRLFEDHKIDTSTVGSCGAGFSWIKESTTKCGLWMHKTGKPNLLLKESDVPALYTMIKAAQPDLMVIALGTNFINNTSVISQASVAAMLQTVKDNVKQCVWIGPPDSTYLSQDKLQDFYDFLTPIAKEYNCKLVDSRQYTQYSGHDGIHYTGTKGINTAKWWATDVYYKEIEPLLKKVN